MKEKTLRQQRINQLIQHTLAEILTRELSFKAGVFATVSKADVSPNLREVEVSISSFPPSEEAYVMETLDKECYTLQGSLNRRLATRPLPRIRFVADHTEAEAQTVDDILLQLKREQETL